MRKHALQGVPLFGTPRLGVVRAAKTACTVYIGELQHVPFLTPQMLRFLFPGEQIASTHVPLDEHGRARRGGCSSPRRLRCSAT